MIEAIVTMYDEEQVCRSVGRAIYYALKATGQQFRLRFMVSGTDDTYQDLLEEFYISNEMDPNVEIVFTGSDTGLGTKVRMGLAAVADDADWVLTMDGDGQCVPEQVSRFWDRCDRSCDAVVGYQDPAEDSRGRTRRFKSFLATRALKLRYGMSANSLTLNYRLYSGHVIREIRGDLESKDFAIQPEIMVRLAKAGYTRIVNVAVSWPEREHGSSKARLSALEYLRLLI